MVTIQLLYLRGRAIGTNFIRGGVGKKVNLDAAE
jgi:hypothetical protein